MKKDRIIPSFVDAPNSFCPGCGHGIVTRVVGECIEELGQSNNMIFTIGIGCGAMAGIGMKVDKQHCAHGRASAVATGIKRVKPDTLVVSLQGDGDAYNIGMGETIGTAYRNENITMITINNTNYGMTGGQMSATTLSGQKTTTTPLGRNSKITGLPFKFPELVAQQFDVGFAARGSVDSVANINKLKSYIKMAFQAQMNKEGFSVVEVLIPCPTNWGKTPIDSVKHIRENVIPEYPIGIMKERRTN